MRRAPPANPLTDQERRTDAGRETGTRCAREPQAGSRKNERGSVARAPRGPLADWRGIGGEAGIRTLGTLAGSPDFESGPFDRSGTSPFIQ